MPRIKITLHHADLKSLVAETPVELSLHLDSIITASPNLDTKKNGKAIVVINGNNGIYVTETVDYVNSIIDQLEEHTASFRKYESAMQKNNEGTAWQSIRVREDAIMGEFKSNLGDYLNLLTIAGPIPVIEPKP